VVKLPKIRGPADWLGDDIKEFPGEFILFSPHVGELNLRDSTAGTMRSITLTKKGVDVLLRADDTQHRWRVFRVDHRPSDKARADAGELADREILPLLWAVPLRGRITRGQFWAFFPTEYVTTLSGILNAPWKLNEDRKALLDGTFNRELLQEASHLIVENLPSW